MANNFKYSGKRVIVQNASAAVASGKLVRQRGFIGIPMTHVAAGASFSMALEGVWGMTYDAFGGGVTIPAGSILYWDVANAALTIGRGANDYAAVKTITAVSLTDGSFDGLLLPQGAPKTNDQS